MDSSLCNTYAADSVLPTGRRSGVNAFALHFTCVQIAHCKRSSSSSSSNCCPANLLIALFDMCLSVMTCIAMTVVNRSGAELRESKRGESPGKSFCFQIQQEKVRTRAASYACTAHTATHTHTYATSCACRRVRCILTCCTVCYMH